MCDEYRNLEAEAGEKELSEDIYGDNNTQENDNVINSNYGKIYDVVVTQGVLQFLRSHNHTLQAFQRSHGSQDTIGRSSSIVTPVS